MCVEPHNSLSAFNCGYKSTKLFWNEQGYCRKFANKLKKGKCFYKWQQLPSFRFLFLTSQLFVDSRYDHRLHNSAKVFVVFDRQRQFFFEMPNCCIHYLVHLATVWNQPVVFPKLDDEILNNSTKIRSLSIFQFIVALSLIHRWRKSVYINKTQIAVVTSCIIFIKWLKVYQGCFLTLKGLRIIYQIVP